MISLGKAVSKYSGKSQNFSTLVVVFIEQFLFCYRVIVDKNKPEASVRPSPFIRN